MEEELAEWTEQAGGRPRWADWIRSQAVRCYRRARKWHQSHGTVERTPPKATWVRAILEAVNASAGVAHFSRFPLSLNLPRQNTDAMWPSVDHSEHPGAALVVIETRVINDMKTILSETEFRQLIGHLAATMGIPPQSLPLDWGCQRDFAGAQQEDEPPLPAAE